MAGSQQLKLIAVIFIATTFVFISSVFASDKVRFTSVGWSGVTVKTELGIKILESLGYSTSNTMAPVPIVYKALATNNADVFLGNWMPSMRTIADKYFKEGSVVQYTANMPGAQYTLAAPAYVVDGGLKDFRDIVTCGEKLDYKIYGLEEGNDGNEVIQSMIDKNIFGLAKFELVTSNEAGMISQVKSFIKKNKWIIFLGWSPHYMNEVIDMKYLTGSTAETFGENNGTATIYTNIRKGFNKENPNVATFLENFRFPIPMMNQIIEMLHDNQDMPPARAGLEWISQNPDIYRAWLKDIKTIDGNPALPAFEKYLKNMSEKDNQRETTKKSAGKPADFFTCGRSAFKLMMLRDQTL